MFVRPFSQPNHGGLRDATATPLAALFRTVRGMGAYLRYIALYLDACGPGKWLIVVGIFPHKSLIFLFSAKTDQIQVAALESTKTVADAAPVR